jgi:hypothetical protein
MPANLFLKHLMVLSDIGGEGLGKITPFDALCFPNGVMRYLWREREHSYSFQTLVNGRKAGSSLLRVDAKGLLTGCRLTPAMKDVIMFLLYGDSAIGDSVPEDIKRKCVVGEYIGRPEELGRFIKRNYIRVSRQLAGAMSNSLGQITQDFVVQCLSEKLQGWDVTRNGSIPGISINEGATEASFDVVAKSPTGVYLGIEVSFQVTTNSVIERKARDAQGLQQRLHERGHFICYVVDGAGNIDVRKSAVRTICRFSDCTVAFTEDEIYEMAQFMLEKP